MSSRPKFCVGELVGIVSVLRPDLNCCETEVLKAEYYNGPIKTGQNYNGWTYRVRANRHQWCEPALRKPSPKSDQSFNSIMTNLKSGKPVRKVDRHPELIE